MKCAVCSNDDIPFTELFQLPSFLFGLFQFLLTSLLGNVGQEIAFAFIDSSELIR